MRKAPSLGIDWFLPKKKRRFATTTVATSNLLALLAEDGLTFSQLYDKINYDDEAKAVIQVFIDKGYGDTPANTWIR